MLLQCFLHGPYIWLKIWGTVLSLNTRLQIAHCQRIDPQYPQKPITDRTQKFDILEMGKPSLFCIVTIGYKPLQDLQMLPISTVFYNGWLSIDTKSQALSFCCCSCWWCCCCRCHCYSCCRWHCCCHCQSGSQCWCQCFCPLQSFHRCISLYLNDSSRER